ncbi:outer membrane protein insertion porin family [Brevundimonas bullata]|uniref:Outer membrane protein assembly factor BamA n=1 Tax=Brevundimonas bullata TaxID=13160 RepID=A0A7W7INY9_9CAUL|nr:outer membrane protein assembly factor BamA [Brevundimonas bullata]MBB4797856.1 outer membrane protein insertion porin family [Brevundimonas bullata]MBB6382815.1 outer membrane protein insertion porin family [Brevundimonas bullata]
MIRTRGRILGPSALALVVAAGLAGPALAQSAPVATPAAAQQDPQVVVAAPAEDRAVVNRIVVRGNQRIDQTTVLSYLPIQPGDTIDAATIDVAVRTLSRTGLFANVQLGLQPNGDLIVEIAENPIINQVTFEGNKALAIKKLTDEVTIKPRGIYTRARVQEDVGKIVELYRLSGRISATVTPKLVQLDQNRVDVVFEIDEGPETGVAAIAFLGNTAFSDSDLREVMVTKESSWWRLFSSNDNYDPNRLDYDREQLRKFYTNRGYYDFRILSSVAELKPDNSAFGMTLTLDEGDRYNFGEVKVVTESDRLNADFLTRLLPIRTGDLYESDRIQSAVDTLTFAAGSAGYAFVEINPTYRANPETDQVDVTFNVKEGQRVYIDRINVVGNTRTLDSVIRRELMVGEGDAFNRSLVERSRNNLRALGFFKDVKIEETRGSAPDRSIVNVTVEEQPTGELSVGAGFSSVDSFVLNLGITERNFRGRGQNFVARAEWGSLRQQIDFRFTEPKFLGRDLRAGFDLFHTRYDLSEYSSYDYRSTGGGLRLSYPLNGYSSFSVRYFLKSDEVIIPSGYCNGTGSSALCDQAGSFMNSSAGYTLLVNRTNDPVRPTRGWSASLRQDFAGIGGDVNYLKTEADASWYHGFSPRWVVSLQGSTGYVSGWNGDPIRINDRFFKGGNTFRGFETAGMGARDLTTTDALGGNFYAIGTVELTVPNYLPEEYGIKTSLFADVGTLGMLDDRYMVNSVTGQPNPNIVDNLALRAAAGVSIHWRSPMGPIRFDLSKVLSKEDYDKTETFRFSTSTQF